VGFEALATTSLGMANALGRVDGEGSVSRAELLQNCRAIGEATDLPVKLRSGKRLRRRSAASRNHST
jgi:2-methylisocitrate lyase-like PEP mutase family enzyme